MSAGLTPKQFVQQVFYVQEKVLLDFYPQDDKYKEVIMEGNLVLQELQKEEDWAWLRATKPLGIIEHNSNPAIQPTFNLGEDVYKIASLYGDCVRLYAHTPLPHDVAYYREHPEELDEVMDYIDPWNVLNVDLVSIGSKNHFPKRQVSMYGKPNSRDMSLGAYVTQNTLHFSRPLVPYEEDRIVVIDYQRVIEQLSASSKVKDIPAMTEIPDPNYVVMKTAYYHAMGSPTAQGMISTLGDVSQKLLSSMRENNSIATSPDYMMYETPGFIEVI